MRWVEFRGQVPVDRISLEQTLEGRRSGNFIMLDALGAILEGDARLIALLREI